MCQVQIQKKENETYRRQIYATKTRSNVLDLGEHALVVFPLVFASSLAIFQNGSGSEARIMRMSLYAATENAVHIKLVFLGFQGDLRHQEAEEKVVLESAYMKAS